MSYYGSHNPPPLPPRSPRPNGNAVVSPAAHPNQNYALPPYNLPPSQSPGYPSAQSPNDLTIFPPPPPGPPPRNVNSPNPNGQYSIPPYRPSPQSPVNAHNPQLSSHSPTPHRPSSTVHQESPAVTPFSQPPTHTPANQAQSPSTSLPSYQGPVLSTHPATQRLSYVPPPVTPQLSEDLEARFQSLTVENPPAASAQRPASYHAPYVPQPRQNYQPSAPAPPSPIPPVSQPNHQIYELPVESQSKHRSYTEPSVRSLPAPPPAVTSCIDNRATFATDWYWHPDAPEFTICSRCYVDHIYGTRFQNFFRSERFTDGKARVCRFSKPRMKECLFESALATGSLDSALEWMRSRPLIPDCKGMDGVKGNAGIKWYRAKENEIPSFVSCQACYEDRILTNNFVVHFEPAPQQPASDTWACDLAVPFIDKEYEDRGKTNDWINFVNETKARLSMKPCPGHNKSLTYGKKWFIPKNGPEGLVLCLACYCDQAIHTGEEAKWEAADSWTRQYDKYVRCGIGIFSIKMAMASGHENKDFSTFWTAVRKLSNEKFCEDDGIENGVWYTLSSDPSNFGVCAGCYVAIAEPLNVSRFFVRKREAQPAGTKWRCCFSVAHPRFRQFITQLLELYHTHDLTSFDKFASVYASTPVCPRDQDEKNRRWYGWDDCTICPECYHDFGRHSPLAAKMDLNNTLLETNRMCELYSPRMRSLYKKCSEANPPDQVPLLEYSAQRRLVWAQTVPQMRMMLFRARMALNQQQVLNATSSFYNNMGMMEEITMPSLHTYSAAGVGYGYANMNLLQGAKYGQQAMNITMNAANGNSVFIVRQLEQQWRAVE